MRKIVVDGVEFTITTKRRPMVDAPIGLCAADALHGDAAEWRDKTRRHEEFRALTGDPPLTQQQRRQWKRMPAWIRKRERRQRRPPSPLRKSVRSTRPARASRTPRRHRSIRTAAASSSRGDPGGGEGPPGPDDERLGARDPRGAHKSRPASRLVADRRRGRQ